MKGRNVMTRFRQVRFHWMAALLLLALGPSIAPSAKQPIIRRHAVMKPHPSSVGSLAPTLKEEGQTFNWSGYSLDSFNTGTPYTSAQGSWVVPSVSYQPTAGSRPQNVASSNWVGIGGTCTDATCNTSDPTLIQLGTESDAFSDGSHGYFAWYELLPDNSVTINDQNGNPEPVSPGDTITASVQCVASCTAGTQAWVLTLVDQTRGWTFTQSFSYASSLTSAEWIQEAPSNTSNTEFQLADFGKSSFTATLANGANPNLNLFEDGIQMIDAQLITGTNMNSPGQLANPSSPTASGAFSVCWASYSGGPDNNIPFPSCSYSGLPAPNTPQLVAAVLPSSRSVTVNTTATVFTTIINPASAQANSCTIQPLANGNSFNGTFFYQTTNPATNATSGTPDTPVNIPAKGSQSFVLGLTPDQASGATNVEFSYVCQGELPAAPIVGVNTLAFSASATPVPDVIALVSTATDDGTLHIPGSGGGGAFAMATANVGAAGSLTASANTGGAALPLTVTLCQSDPTTSQCLTPPATSVPVTIAAGAEPTFSIFAASAGTVPFNAATNRIFVQFTDGTGTVRGSSSVAVTTQ